MINPIQGDLKPLRDHVLATDMNFEEQVTASGIIIQSDDGKSEGIKPRWCRVYKIGFEQKDVKVGEWILVEHGRWTRGVKLQLTDGNIIEVRRIDCAGILASADERPSGLELGSLSTVTPGGTYDFNDMQRALI
jgi:co-chaperonin GroES (HSP10)